VHSILLGLHILVAIGLIALVLIQHGKGADVGAAFGSGASGTVFGARGSASFLSRVTAVMAALFFAISMSLAYLGTQRVDRGSVVERVQPAEEAQAVEAPEQPASGIPDRPPQETPPVDIPALPPE
jgi:preprotein translocase subunit SecG